MKNQHLKEKDLLKKGTEVLLENLGAVDAARFLSLSGENRVESVRRHRSWQTKLSKEEFFKKVFGNA